MTEMNKKYEKEILDFLRTYQDDIIENSWHLKSLGKRWEIIDDFVSCALDASVAVPKDVLEQWAEENFHRIIPEWEQDGKYYTYESDPELDFKYVLVVEE